MQAHNKPGYYWILDGPRDVYCGMTYTGSSCEDIYNNNPEIREKSGYYRINSNQWIHCDMMAIATANGDFISTCAGVGGGWRRIVNINVSAGDDCPGEWRMATESGVSFCRVGSDSSSVCSSASFSTNGISYQRVCGRARGYQKGDTTGFYGAYVNELNDQNYENYVAGLSITYSSAHQHIWTFASGQGETLAWSWNCRCTYANAFVPSYVGNSHYCESASWYCCNYDTYYFNDTLWDGEGCTDNCCDDTTQPWFYRDLNQTTQDYIEARICSSNPFNRASTLIDQLELYIQ